MSEDRSTRARRLAASASTDTVTERLLLGGNEYSGEMYLYDAAPIDRLDDTEQPHATLFNDRKGVGVGSKRDTVTPNAGGKSVFVVTDRRLLLLVGKPEGDWSQSVPLEEVTGAEYSTGIMKHRVMVSTPSTQYHLWINADYDESTLDAVASLLEAGGLSTGAAAASESATGVATDGATAGGGGSDGGDDDPLETLERLKELNEQGVVSDEEFAEKKSDLLDQI